MRIKLRDLFVYQVPLRKNLPFSGFVILPLHNDVTLGWAFTFSNVPMYTLTTSVLSMTWGVLTTRCHNDLDLRHLLKSCRKADRRHIPSRLNVISAMKGEITITRTRTSTFHLDVNTRCAVMIRKSHPWQTCNAQKVLT